MLCGQCLVDTFAPKHAGSMPLRAAVRHPAPLPYMSHAGRSECKSPNATCAELVAIAHGMHPAIHRLWLQSMQGARAHTHVSMQTSRHAEDGHSRHPLMPRPTQPHPTMHMFPPVLLQGVQQAGLVRPPMEGSSRQVTRCMTSPSRRVPGWLQHARATGREELSCGHPHAPPGRSCLKACKIGLALSAGTCGGAYSAQAQRSAAFAWHLS